MAKPNHSNEAEQAVIQICLISDGGDLVDTLTRMLKPEFFYVPVHAEIWKTILTLYSQNLAADPVSLATANESLDMSYLVDLCSNYASSANGKHYAMIIKERYEMRNLITTLSNSMSLIMEGEKDWATSKSEVAEMLDSAMSARGSGSRGLVHASSIAKDWIRGVVDQQEGKPSEGFTTGIPELDSLLAPKLLVPGSLVVVGARPKMGKSALLAKLTGHFGTRLQMPSLIFSMEMGDQEVVERLITGESDLSPDVFYRPMTSDQFQKLTDGSGKIIKSEIYIDDTPGLTVEHIKSESRKISRKKRVGIIAVDYLTLMSAPKADRNDLAYGNITKQLKNLARELNCIVLLLTQLNRSLESRTNIIDRKPSPSDSRDTGQIEQDCDIWIGLFRAGAYETVPNPGLTELLVRLNRKGKTGSVYLDMKAGYFESMDATRGAVQDHENREALSQQTTKKSARGFDG
jgi:replicative DNA helicase